MNKSQRLFSLNCHCGHPRGEHLHIGQRGAGACNHGRAPTPHSVIQGEPCNCTSFTLSPHQPQFAERRGKKS